MKTLLSSVGVCLIAVALAVCVAAPADAQVWRVDKSATGANNGTSWQNAYTTIQPAIDAAFAAGGGEVWVAGGPLGSPVVYNEVRTETWGSGNHAGALVLKDNVAVYGGFEGWRGGAGMQETSLSQRVRAQNIAIIDGSTARGGSPAYHVVVVGRGSASTLNARLDGFHITGGNAAGVSGHYDTYRGGGIYNWRSNPVIANCYIYGNTASVSGGGVANEGISGAPANAQYINTVIAGNTASRNIDWQNNPARGGGGAFNNLSSPSYTHVTISANVTGAGGALPGMPTNFGLNSGGIYNVAVGGLPAAAPALLSGIVWANTGANGIVNDAITGAVVAMTATFSDVAGGYAGTGNINADPNFSGAFPWAYQITGAPCVDAGSSAIADDIRGVPRPLGAGRDMGAYEFSANGPVATCQPHTVSMGANCEASMTVSDIDGGSTAEVGVWKLEASQTTFDSDDVPSTTVVLTVTDILGRTANCNAVVTVDDPIEPVAVCQDITVFLSAPLVLAEAIDGGSTDNCAIATRLIDGAADRVFTCADRPSVVVTLTVEDAAGNMDTCQATITVVDNVPPVITIPGGNALTAECGVAFSLPAVTAVDNCDGPVALLVDLDGLDANDPQVGVYNVEYSAIDSAGNPNAEVLVVTVLDTLAPVITITGGNSLVADCGIPLALPTVTALDACDGDISLNINVDLDGLDLGDPQIGTYNVVYSVTDSASLFASETLTVQVVDVLPPVITRIGPAVISHSLGEPYNDLGATAFDACEGDLTLSIITVNPVDPNIEDTYTVTYNVSDSVPNAAAQVTRTVIVQIPQPNLVDVSVETGVTVLVEYNRPMGFGVDTPANYTLSGSGQGSLSDHPASVELVAGNVYRLTWPATQEMFNGGDITITVDQNNVEDDEGNFMGMPNELTDEGGAIGEAPVITLNGADETLECGVDTFVEAGASAEDNVDGPVAVDISGDELVSDTDPGVYVITYTAVDTAGNTAVETRTITVQDTTDPELELVGPSELQLECNLEDYVELGASAWDACDGELEVVIVGGANTAILGVQVISYSATDGEGNVASLEREVTVVDTTPPMIALLGADPFVLADGAAYIEAGAEAWDDCEGDLTPFIEITGEVANTDAVAVYVLTYSVSDTSENSAMTTRTVVVKPEDCLLAFGLEVSPNPAVPGEEVTFQVTDLPGSCSAGTLEYVWQKAPLSGKQDFAVIPGAPNAPTYVIASATFDDAGVYKCTVSDAADSVDTNEVTLYVGTGVPAASMLGVALAAMAAALAGAASIRKRR